MRAIGVDLRLAAATHSAPPTPCVAAPQIQSLKKFRLALGPAELAQYRIGDRAHPAWSRPGDPRCRDRPAAAGSIGTIATAAPVWPWPPSQAWITLATLRWIEWAVRIAKADPPIRVAACRRTQRYCPPAFHLEAARIVMPCPWVQTRLLTQPATVKHTRVAVWERKRAWCRECSR